MDPDESPSISLPGSSKRENDTPDPDQPYKKCKSDDEQKILQVSVTDTSGAENNLQKFRYTRSELETGSIHDRGDFDDIFIWKISNVLSIPQVDDYVVHSPPFYYEGAYWILKICPFGLSKPPSSEGHIDFKIERLHSEIEKHVIITKIFFGNPFDKIYKEIDERFTFDSSCSEETLYSMVENPKEGPKKWQCAPNNVFTLAVAFRIFLKNKNCMSETAVGETHMANKYTRSQEFGEVFKDSFNLKCSFWKVCGLTASKFSKDRHLESPLLFFSNATWILKLYRSFRMSQPNNPSFDIVLERLHSETQDHYVILQLDIGYSIKIDGSGSFFFNIHHAHKNVITLQLKEKGIPKCLHFNINIYVKTNDRTEDSQMKFSKPSSDLGCSSMSKVPMALSGIKALADFKELFLKQEGCDVIIKVKGQQFQAHRAILRARSSVFASTFRTDMKEKATGIVEIEDCDPSSFSDFLCFLYSGNVGNLSTENVFSLFTTADKYDIQDLRSECMEFMKKNLSISTFCDTITLARQYSEKELMKLSLDFFGKNLQDIIKTVEWQSLLTENPIKCNELMIEALECNKTQSLV